MKALIVADGDVPSRAVVDALLAPDGAQLVIAADGGALKALALGFRPDVVIGDFDSLPAGALDDLRAQGAEVHVYPAQKDESDTELAVAEAIDRGARALVIIGAFGGARLEHTIGNLLLLAKPELMNVWICLADGSSEVRLISGGRLEAVRGSPGDYISLFPLTPTVEVAFTDGLEYPLIDEQLVQGPARGLSNVMTSNEATVAVRAGRLLVVHTRLER